MASTDIFQPKIDEHKFDNRLLVRRRAIAAGAFVASTLSIFGVITYLLIYFLAVDASARSLTGSFVVPFIWTILSIVHLVFSADKFVQTDEELCKEYYDEAEKQAKKRLMVVEPSTDADTPLGFCMRDVSGKHEGQEIEVPF
tara:strand:- start:9664 stop:10089 length:426 start_codon:yes stop_codon:yes gene_type:complete